MKQDARSAVPQQGQALLEGVVVLTALLLLWIAIPWLSRLQHIALTAQHASSYAAFTVSRSAAADLEHSSRQHFFSGPAHQWLDRSGNAVLAKLDESVGVGLEQHKTLSAVSQPGGQNPSATALRRDWGIEDGGVLKASVSITPGGSPRNSGKEPPSSRVFPVSAYPSLQRHTAILTGAGHASNDVTVQETIAHSPLAWGSSAITSYGVGRRISSAMTAVDAGWQRTNPVFDWLTEWAGHVPEEHLVSSLWGAQ